MRPDYIGTRLQKILDILAEGMLCFALNVDCPNDIVSRSIEHGYDDLGASSAKRSQVTGIG
jgi:hypothetical protein